MHMSVEFETEAAKFPFWKYSISPIFGTVHIFAAQYKVRPNFVQIGV
jgi:hypothetical protein